MADVITPGSGGWPSAIPERIIQDAAYWEGVASGAVRDFCGWHVSPIVTEKMVLDGRGGEQLLPPSGRILEVISCLVEGEDVTAEVVGSSRTGIVEFRDCGRRWPVGVGTIELTIRHGYSPGEAPAVMGVVAGLASRLSDGVRVRRQQVGSASVDYTASAADLFGAEQRSLERYRLRWGS